MRDSDGDTTIGVGGWGLVLLAAVVTFAVLHKALHYLAIPSALFALAIALVVLLLLHRLAAAVGRYEDDEEASRIRKIVPATAETGGRPVEGASGAVGVPVRPETVTPHRPSSVVTPLARVEAPPVIQPLPVAAPAVMPVAPVLATDAVPAAKPAAKPKAKAAPKAVAEPKADKAKAEPKPKAEAKSKAEPKPKAEPTPKTEKVAKPKAAKPEGLVRLKAPRKGRADDLQEIEGIGPALEKLVNGLGFYHYDQIAAWTEADIATVDTEMKTFKGRITRDKWVEQAKIIVAEGLEAFRERARTNDY
jgi:predicted flap endonuclease-1-like 5' DNA nuclease